MTRTNLLGRNQDELNSIALKLGESSYRGRQLFNWIYQKGAKNFNSISNIPHSFKFKLEERFNLDTPTIEKYFISDDGTQKFLIAFEDKNKAECVIIPETDRTTLCISSQIGCTLTCKFCYTGTQRLVRNLKASEILGQIILAKNKINDWPAGNKTHKTITNIVLMGMGEPLFNFSEISKAMRIAMAPNGLAFSKRKITLSTAGIPDGIQRCGEELGISLAVSLHAPNDEIRSKLMPINKKYPIKSLMEACKNYRNLSNARRISFEYAMIRDINDSDADARSLVKLVDEIPCKFNLIPFNPWPGATYKCSSNKRIEQFQKILLNAGITCPIRKPRGIDILAACGQLRTSSAKY